jgi:predicted DNA-binding transcriptional regulator YafY
MSYRSAIKRYISIIDLLSTNQFPSLEYIFKNLSDEGIKTSERTIQRDFQALKEEFGIEVVYNKFKDGYFIDSENSTSPKTFIRILEILNTAEIIADTIKDNKESLKYLSLESSVNLKGIENLKYILKAIKDSKIISFKHQSFYNDTSRISYLKPYGLKEYMNRWYVIGVVQGLNELRTYGIDRIEELKITDKKFTPDTKLNPLANFEQIVGVVYSLHEMTKVVLSFSPNQGKYIKTLPIHASQTTLVDNQEEFKISLYLKPNYELIQKIMMYNQDVKVIEPSWLAKEILERAKKMIKNYS